MSDELWSHYPGYNGPGHLNNWEDMETDDVSHPLLHGLHRTTRTTHPSGRTDAVKYESHQDGERHTYRTAQGWEHTAHGRHGSDGIQGGPFTHDTVGPDLWDEAELMSNIATKHPPISLRTKALLHKPEVAADSLEEEGHDALAHMLRHAELVHTYHGEDAKHSDALFIHNNRPHLVVRGNGGVRYHYVGRPS